MIIKKIFQDVIKSKEIYWIEQIRLFQQKFPFIFHIHIPKHIHHEHVSDYTLYGAGFISLLPTFYHQFESRMDIFLNVFRYSLEHKMISQLFNMEEKIFQMEHNISQLDQKMFDIQHFIFKNGETLFKSL